MKLSQSLTTQNEIFVLQLVVTANVLPSSLTLFTLIMEVILFLKCWFLQEPHSVTFQKIAFFIVTIV
jgi:hypothetical protein